MLSLTDEIDAIQASVLRALASPHRLRIVHRLGVGLPATSPSSPGRSG